MADQYMKNMLRIAVSQICQTIGYSSAQISSLELLQDVLDKFMKEFSRDLLRHVEHCNRTHATLHDVRLTLKSLHINYDDLINYITNVESVPFAIDITKFPVHKKSSFNFLPPGSKELLTRPEHIYDYLPPMQPPEITPQIDTISINSTITDTNQSINEEKLLPCEVHNGDMISICSSKTSTDTSVSTLPSILKSIINMNDGGDESSARSNSSVVISNDGFIVSAVEGKLPDDSIPNVIQKLIGFDEAPPPSPQQSLSSEQNNDNTSSILSLTSDDKVSISVESLDTENKNRTSIDSLDDNTPSTSAFCRKLAERLTTQSNTIDKVNNLKPRREESSTATVPNITSPKKPVTSPGGHNTFANMLLKKAKKQKTVAIHKNDHLEDTFIKGPTDDAEAQKLNAVDKIERKYGKMLQKMAKQGKIPMDVLNALMGPDKKLRHNINPDIVQSLPTGPEKMQLEKLLRKQSKQRQKFEKQQIIESKKLCVDKKINSKIDNNTNISKLDNEIMNCKSKNLNVPKTSTEENNISSFNLQTTKDHPLISTNTSQLITASSSNNLIVSEKDNETVIQTQMDLLKKNELTLISETLDNRTVQEIKLSSEPDRNKLNIFKKISKQKASKSATDSSAIACLTGLPDASLINLPSGTTITPAPGPIINNTSTPASTTIYNLPSTTITPSNNILSSRSLFSSEITTSTNVADLSNNILKNTIVNDGKIPDNINGLTSVDRIFGTNSMSEKVVNFELLNKPKKRGRKPGSKNSPKVPGMLIGSSPSKKGKRIKSVMDNFDPVSALSLQTPTSLINPLQAFDVQNNLMHPNMFALNESQFQQQMLPLMVPTNKERKERKKNKIMKNTSHNVLGSILPHAGMLRMDATDMSSSIPTNEEVQSINKKLMRMDTTLKPAPGPGSTTNFMSTSNMLNDLNPDISKLLNPAIKFESNFTNNPSFVGTSSDKRLNANSINDSNIIPFMLPNRPTGFTNLPSNMLSMLQFPFPPRPGLIPTHGIFPTPSNISGFTNNPKNSNTNLLLPGSIFPFTNLLPNNTPADIKMNSDYQTSDKSSDSSFERNYCNVPPLVPEFLKLTSPVKSNYESRAPKQQKLVRNSENESVHNKHLRAQTPDVINNAPLPTTPGSITPKAYEQILKGSNQMELGRLNNIMTKQFISPDKSSANGIPMALNQEFGSSQKQLPMVTNRPPPITINADDPIELSDDSDDLNTKPAQRSSPQSMKSVSYQSYNINDIFGQKNTSFQSNMLKTSANKERKKMKKHSRKIAPILPTNLITACDKTDGVGKLAGGADLIPLSSTGQAYSSKSIPFNSLTANAIPSFGNHSKEHHHHHLLGSNSATTMFDHALTITPAIRTSSGSNNTNITANIFDQQLKKRKEHKKLKKLKELKDGKIKKKKDKKDKIKNKEKLEKFSIGQHLPQENQEIKVYNVDSVDLIEKKSKEKDLLRKLKKEKKKEKQRLSMDSPIHSLSASASTMNEVTNSSIGTGAVGNIDGLVSDERKCKDVQQTSGSSGSVSTSSLILTSPASVNSGISTVPKITLKFGQSPISNDDRHSPHKISHSPRTKEVREPSPELARISPLITRPPKKKSNAVDDNLSSTSSSADNSSLGNLKHHTSNLIIPPPSPWLAGGTISASSVLLPQQLLQSSKSHDILMGNTSSISMKSSHQGSGETSRQQREHTNSKDRHSPLTLMSEISRPSSYIDAEGNRVWICPACGKVDDGSPMIGCDGCDAWYHWVCVGIIVAPKDNEDWFCRVCITRKKGIHGMDKKRRRNKKK